MRREVPVANLLLDLSNPRLPRQESQREATRAVVQKQGDKLLTLAQDIVEAGLDPSALWICIQDEQDTARFVVVEGNRRLTALRVLINPDIVLDLYDTNAGKRLKKLAADFDEAPITDVPCVILLTRDVANRWIALRHGGEQGGKGIVPWGAIEAARFEELQGRDARASPALQAVNLVRSRGNLAADVAAHLGDVPITTIQRVLNDPDVRARLGIEIESGKLLSRFPEDEVLKGLTRIICDAATGELPVSRVDTKELRAKYLSEFSARELPSKGAKKAESPQPLGGGGSTPAASAPRRAQQSTEDRTTLIPRKCTFSITDTKTNNIYKELKKLKVNDYRHAVAVLFRVFLELCVDHYIVAKKLLTSFELDKKNLGQKLNLVANHLQDGQVLTKRQLTGARKAADSNKTLDCSIETLHGYVHDASLGPAPIDLKAAWDTLELFFQTICL